MSLRCGFTLIANTVGTVAAVVLCDHPSRGRKGFDREEEGTGASQRMQPTSVKNRLQSIIANDNAPLRMAA